MFFVRRPMDTQKHFLIQSDKDPTTSYVQLKWFSRGHIQGKENKINNKLYNQYAQENDTCDVQHALFSQSFFVTMKGPFYCKSGRLGRAILIQSFEYFKSNYLHISA